MLPSRCFGLLPISLRCARGDVVFVHEAERIYALYFHSVSCLYDTYDNAGARELVHTGAPRHSYRRSESVHSGSRADRARISLCARPKARIFVYSHILEDAYFVSILHRFCALYAL